MSGELPQDDGENFEAMLIETVQHFPCIYDKGNRYYKNTPVREAAWKKIGETLNREPADCSKRWNQLRESFARELRKRAEEERSGSGLSQRRGFTFFQEMSYLQRHISKRRAYSNVPYRSMAPRQWSVQNAVCVQGANQVPSKTLPESIFVSDLESDGESIKTSVLETESATETSSPSAREILKLEIMSPPPSVESPECSGDTTGLTNANLPGTSLRLSSSLLSPASLDSGSSTISDFSGNRSIANSASLSTTFENMTQSLLESSNCALSSWNIGDDSFCPAGSSINKDSQGKMDEGLMNLFSSLPSSRAASKQESTEIISTCTAPTSKHSSCYNPKTAKNKKADKIESSFITLSSAIQNHLTKELNVVENRRTKEAHTTDEIFANFIASELSTMEESKKVDKKKRILQILYKSD